MVDVGHVTGYFHFAKSLSKNMPRDAIGATWPEIKLFVHEDVSDCASVIDLKFSFKTLIRLCRHADWSK